MAKRSRILGFPLSKNQADKYMKVAKNQPLYKRKIGRGRYKGLYYIFRRK